MMHIFLQVLCENRYLPYRIKNTDIANFPSGVLQSFLPFLHECTKDNLGWQNFIDRQVGYSYIENLHYLENQLE